MAPMNLRYDPYQVFRSSKTPAGLYARQKWLGEAESRQWKIDFEETVSTLFADQLPDMLLTGAGLFLASIFGREQDPTIVSIYQRLSDQGVKSNGHWFDQAASHNIFRAMVVHPVFSEDKATALAVEHLANFQSKSGDWGIAFTFHQTLNALAHLNLAQAETQLEKAFERLFATQNSDGSWSRTDPEWNTFLAIHALRNKGLI